jgi:hypothetical protein
MEQQAREAALAFIHKLALPPAPPAFRAAARDAAPPVDAEVEHRRAALVGSEIVSFVDGVTPQRRRLVVQSTLLAQLAAKRKVPNAAKVFDWYRAYLDVLGNIGWAIQDTSFRNCSSFAEGFDAHEAIAAAAAEQLGPGPALAAVMATVQALQKAGGGTPWFTLFSRESQKASTAHFQISLVHGGGGDAFLVSLMAFAITAEQDVTQVAFFRFDTRRASLDQLSAQVTVGLEPGSDIAEAIAAKVAGYQADYVQALEI